MFADVTALSRSLEMTSISHTLLEVGRWLWDSQLCETLFVSFPDWTLSRTVRSPTVASRTTARNWTQPTPCCSTFIAHLTGISFRTRGYLDLPTSGGCFLQTRIRSTPSRWAVHLPKWKTTTDCLTGRWLTGECLSQHCTCLYNKNFSSFQFLSLWNRTGNSLHVGWPSMACYRQLLAWEPISVLKMGISQANRLGLSVCWLCFLTSGRKFLLSRLNTASHIIISKMPFLKISFR